MAEFTHSFRVPFADSDAAGIVHFSRLLPHVEAAEAAWLESLDLRQYELAEGGAHLGFAKVAVHCDYRSPMRPGDDVALRLLPVKAGESSFTYAFRATVGQKTAAEGTITILYATLSPDGIQKRPLPDALRRLAPAT